MVQTITNNETSYRCEECGMRYRDKAWAEKCEAWCSEHHTCHIEIIEQAIPDEEM